MKNESYRQFLPGVIIIAVALLVSAAGGPLFNGADDAILTLQYRLRGQSAADSSVVVIYFSDDDIAALGGLPLKRSYYALLVDALDNLGAGVIGMDIAFTEQDNEHPEYDRLLAAEIEKSGRVVLSGYFHSTGPGLDTASSGIPERFTYSLAGAERFPSAAQPGLPLSGILAGAGGFGHTNLDEGFNIPVFLKTDHTLVPSFALEVLRQEIKADRTDVSLEGSAVRLAKGGRSFLLPFGPGGVVRINYTGGTGALNTLSAIKFLQAYDTLTAGGRPSLETGKIRGSIVLIGIIAEGRSAFITTPFSPQYPLIGVHATMIENALRGDFLSWCPGFLEYFIAGFSGLIALIYLLLHRERSGLPAIAGFFGIACLLSFGLFAGMAFVLPLSRLTFTLLAITFGALILKHRTAREEVGKLKEEKTSIANILAEKEQTVALLERELTGKQQELTAERTTRLVEEIRRYKDEIRSLQDRAGDLQPFTDRSPGGTGAAVEYCGMLYHSEGPMAPVIEFVKKISDSDAAVLILGESGTGKELIAKAIHQSSKRREKAFIAVNCGALTETLLESELFGHEKGAFTGAVKERPGRFELANEGTIFLDEVAETSEDFQVKLLRVLQEGTFERVGGVETRKTDVRVIAATNRDVRRAVEEGSFRKDLYYRLNVFTVLLPPLRERRLDIPLLAGCFASAEMTGMAISTTVMAIILQHPWKGNVRELQSVIKHSVLMAKAEGRGILQLKDLPEDVRSMADSTVDLEDRILDLLRAKGFSRNAISETAEELDGLNRGTVAEYFRGYCFKTFADNRFDVAATVTAITPSADAPLADRVQRKLLEYLANAVENVDHSRPLDEALAVSKPKYKNLPQRYHPFLDTIIAAYHRKDWSL